MADVLIPAGGTVALVLAAGAGERLGASIPKAFVPIGDRPMLVVALQAALRSPAIDAVVLVVPAEGVEVEVGDFLQESGAGRGPRPGPAKSVTIVRGGATRQASVRLGLEAVPPEARIVVVHDAARPFATSELFDRVVEALASAKPADRRIAAAIPVVASSDTVKRVRDGVVVETLERAELALSQTPQAFLAEALRAAHAGARASASGPEATDDAMLVEAAGFGVVTIPGEASNFKITTPEDLARARSSPSAGPQMVKLPDDIAPVGISVRSGFGFDTHRFDDERPLYLAGVRFDDTPGLAGHSDGDAVCHAVADALLGAIAAGDVGEHFADDDPAIAGIAGLDLLRRTVAIVAARGVRPATCDVTVLAERPSIAPRRDEMRRTLAGALGVDDGAVSVKATRPEGLGLTGAGIGCMALVTVVALDAP